MGKVKNSIDYHNDQKGTCFILLVYPEYLDSILYDLSYLGYDYVYICHDRDIKKGFSFIDYRDNITSSVPFYHCPCELIGKHYHFIVSLLPKMQYRITQLSKELLVDGVPFPTRLIQVTQKDPIKFLRYLIHLGEQDKHQYKVNDLCGCLGGRLYHLLLDNLVDHQISNENAFAIAYDFIKKNSSSITQIKFFDFLVDNDLLKPCKPYLHFLNNIVYNKQQANRKIFEGFRKAGDNDVPF